MNPLDVEHTCPHRRLAKRMAKLCEPRLLQPAVPWGRAKRVFNSRRRRKDRSELRARIRRHRGRNLNGVQYKLPCFGPLPELKKSPELSE